MIDRRGVLKKYKSVVRDYINKSKDIDEVKKAAEALGLTEKRRHIKPIKCCCCARQLVSYEESTDRTVSGKNATLMGPGMYACYECSQDLDENGLFPEERY